MRDVGKFTQLTLSVFTCVVGVTQCHSDKEVQPDRHYLADVSETVSINRLFQSADLHDLGGLDTASGIDRNFRGGKSPLMQSD